MVQSELKSLVKARQNDSDGVNLNSMYKSCVLQESITAELSARISCEYTYHEIYTYDEYVTGEYRRIAEVVTELESMGFYGDTDISRAIERKRSRNRIDYNNPATAKMIRCVPGIEHWLRLVPNPAALESLYDPNHLTLQGGHLIGEELRNWFIEIDDTRGIRDRSQMVSDVILREIAAKDAYNACTQKWLSLASGVAQPMLKTARKVADLYGSAPQMTLLDYNSRALRDARKFAAGLGLERSLDTRRMNVLRLQGVDERIRIDELALQYLFNNDKGWLSLGKIAPAMYDFVEAIGILEYVDAYDWPYRYEKVANMKSVLQAGALTFLTNSYRLVKPGGDLLVGNMLRDRPQLGFTLNVVQWPHIRPRSIDEMIGIFNKAGLEGERHVYVSSDPSRRIYALYRIHKPE